MSGTQMGKAVSMNIIFERKGVFQWRLITNDMDYLSHLSFFELSEIIYHLRNEQRVRYLIRDSI